MKRLINERITFAILFCLATTGCCFAEAQYDANGSIARIGTEITKNLLAEPVNIRIVERAFVKQERQKSVPVQSDAQIVVENQHTVLDGLHLQIAKRVVQRVIEDKDVAAAKTAANGYTKSVKEAGLSWTVTRQPAGSGIKLSVELTNQFNHLRSLDVEFPVVLKGNDYRAFFPGPNDFPEWSEGSALAYGLRCDDWTDYNPYLSQPMCTLFSETRDVGLTLAADYNYPIQPITFYAAKSGGGTAVLVTFLRVRLDPRGGRTLTLHLQPHPGDWRCGLAYARDTWPDLFTVEPEAYRNLAPSFGGTGSLGNYYPECFTQPSFFRNYMWKWNPWRRMTIEMMGLDHGQGQYMSESPVFTNALGEKWHHLNGHPDWYPKGFLDGKPDKDAPYEAIVRWMENRPESMFEEIFRRGFSEHLEQTVYYWYKTSYDGIKRFIATAKDHGCPMFMYWNPRDVWYPFAKDRFSDLIIGRDENYFGFDVAYTVPVEGSSFYRYQKSQLNKMLGEYTGLDGFFIDQCYGGGKLVGKDDGISVTDEGKPAADFNVGLASMTRAAKQIARKHGKLMWSNHCNETIDIVGNSDLALAEDREAAGMGQEIGRYAMIGNRPGVNLRNGELVMQASLRNGMVGQTAHISGVGADDYDVRLKSDEAWACRLYQPMFDLIGDKEWCLEPHCLTLPAGFDGNLFRVDRERNLFATVIAFGENFCTPWTRFDVPVTINVKDAAEVKAAYLIGAANLGAYKIPFERDGNKVTVRIPRFKGTASVLFAKAGRFVSVASDNPIGSAGGTWGYNLAVDNFTSEPWSWKGTIWQGGSPSWQWEEIPAGKSAVASFKVDTPKDYTKPFSIVVLAKESPSRLPSEDKAGQHFATFEFFVDKPVLASIAPSRAMVTKTISNSSQGGYKPLHQPFSLHVLTGETAELTLGVVNNNVSVENFSVEVAPAGVTVDGVPASIAAQPRSRANFRFTVKGAVRGQGGVKITLRDRNGAVAASDEIKFEVIGKSLSDADLARVKSVSLYYDIWGSTRAGGADTKAITLNGVKVGNLEVSGGYQCWVTRVKTALSDEARTALRTGNAVTISNPTDSFWKIRNIFMEVQLEDGSTIHLLSDQQTFSSPATNPWAEGRRLEPGEAVGMDLK